MPSVAEAVERDLIGFPPQIAASSIAMGAIRVGEAIDIATEIKPESVASLQRELRATMAELNRLADESHREEDKLDELRAARQRRVSS